MADSLTGKLLSSHLRSGRIEAGADVTLDVDHVLLEDATATMTAMQFEELGTDRVQVPLAVCYVDHNVLQIDERNMADHEYLRSFCRHYGLRYSPPGHGISHYVHLERFARPGQLLLGADSHSTMAGAAGMLAIGAGGLPVAVAMAGHGYALPCHRVIAVELAGRLSDWVEAKDVILEILRRHGVRGGRGAIFEFTGDGVTGLSVTQRATIANMIVETGATSAVFPSDERVREWLTTQDRAEEFVPLAADPGADYDGRERIDLAGLRPLIALPQSPGNVVEVTDVVGTGVVQVCVGSSVNSSYEDLATVAAVLADKQVDPALSLTVTPGSRQILDTIVRSGVYSQLAAAGARMLEPVCGPCIGIGQAPTRGEPSVRRFNRNFPGRSGTAEDSVYLCSPSTAAATAMRGAITDPRELGKPVRLAPARAHPGIDDRHIQPAPPAGEAADVEVVRGPNLMPPPRPPVLDDEITGRVAIVVGDDVSTGDMAPDGAIGMAVWSNVAACADYMFARFDPQFPDRARARGGGVIVAGENYGQGSSREHAALSPLHLGIRAVIAKSYARIHRANLIAQGIAPLVFGDGEDHARARTGDEWRVSGLRSTGQEAGASLRAHLPDGASIELSLPLSEKERATLLAGGMLREVLGGAR
jgi:aconitate hydratase